MSSLRRWPSASLRFCSYCVNTNTKKKVFLILPQTAEGYEYKKNGIKNIMGAGKSAKTAPD